MNEFIEYSFFESTEANKNFNYWINHEPESFGGHNLERFTDMVISILDNDEDLESSHLTHSTNRLKEYMVTSYMERYIAMKAIYKELKSRFRIIQ